MACTGCSALSVREASQSLVIKVNMQPTNLRKLRVSSHGSVYMPYIVKTDTKQPKATALSNVVWKGECAGQAHNPSRQHCQREQQKLSDSTFILKTSIHNEQDPQVQEARTAKVITATSHEP